MTLSFTSVPSTYFAIKQFYCLVAAPTLATTNTAPSPMVVAPPRQLIAMPATIVPAATSLLGIPMSSASKSTKTSSLAAYYQVTSVCSILAAKSITQAHEGAEECKPLKVPERSRWRFHVYENSAGLLLSDEAHARAKCKAMTTRHMKRKRGLIRDSYTYADDRYFYTGLPFIPYIFSIRIHTGFDLEKSEHLH
jgi:hypothetical protein